LSQDPKQDRLCVQDIGAVAVTILQRVGLAVAGFTSRHQVAIQYLRLKPGRGLIVALRTLACGPKSGLQLLTVIMGEEALEGSYLRFGWDEVTCAALEKSSSGIVRAPELSLSLHAFPVDAKLPILATCFDTSPQGLIFSTLEAAARVQLGEARWTLASFGVEPLRYKVGHRCVLAYKLQGTDGRMLAIVGKLYADPGQARLVHSNLQRLYGHLDSETRPLPKPLEVVDQLGLTYTEAIAPPEAGIGSSSAPLPPNQPGSAWRPRPQRLSTGNFTVPPPGESSRLAGIALAQLHSARLRPQGEGSLSTSLEIEQVDKRVQRLMSWQPAQAVAVSRLGAALAERLKRSAPDRYVVAHGSYKHAQVVLSGGRAFVIDFDRMCWGDPALDVGSFLAYLRPAGMYHGRSGYDEWFEVAASQFVRAYRETRLVGGADDRAVKGVLERARLFEASRLIKIAARPMNRLNSPRPLELMSIGGEIEDCLDNAGRWA
jgi:hypothetical protein